MKIVLKAVRHPVKTLKIIEDKLLKSLGHRNYKPFIVLTRSRTGSNMLLSMLNSHPNIDVRGEIFSKLNGRNYKDILNTTFAKQPFYIKAAGFKIFYYHPQDDKESDVWKDLADMNNLSVIQLKRKNVLRSLISSKIASKQGVWRTEQSSDARAKGDKAITFTVEELERGFVYTRRREQKGENTFSEHPFLSICYEDLLVDMEGNIKTICDFLEVPYKMLQTPLKRQNPESMRDLVSNYDELKNAFSGTEWELHFDE